MRGAWIEIFAKSFTFHSSASRSPCGERGLKFLCTQRVSVQVVSLPMRGAWIEINVGVTTEMPKLVAPHAGSVD